jgi:hypothetical protein
MTLEMCRSSPVLVIHALADNGAWFRPAPLIHLDLHRGFQFDLHFDIHLDPHLVWGHDFHNLTLLDQSFHDIAFSYMAVSQDDAHGSRICLMVVFLP